MDQTWVLGGKRKEEIRMPTRALLWGTGWVRDDTSLGWGTQEVKEACMQDMGSSDLGVLNRD